MSNYQEYSSEPYKRSIRGSRGQRDDGRGLCQDFVVVGPIVVVDDVVVVVVVGSDVVVVGTDVVVVGTDVVVVGEVVVVVGQGQCRAGAALADDIRVWTAGIDTPTSDTAPITISFRASCAGIGIGIALVSGSVGPAISVVRCARSYPTRPPNSQTVPLIRRRWKREMSAGALTASTEVNEADDKLEISEIDESFRRQKVGEQVFPRSHAD